jgi:phosphatidylserine/phosphatidylglycerophosphate/cardiolipin synthase-like enzyme
VFTVPDGVNLPEEASHLSRSLAKRVFDALTTANERTLLASPYWSDQGAEELWAPLQTSVGLALPVTLAGAKPDPKRDDLQAMLRLASRLEAAGASVRALEFVPPRPQSIFHAKIVAGAVGYLGSANLTTSGLGLHVEAGLPLDEPDVEQVWWLLDVLFAAGLLREVPAAG